MSSELPGLEARMSAQERLQTILHARIEEVSQDMNTNFRQLVEYQRQNKREMEARFDKSDAFMKAIAQDVHDSFKQQGEYQLEFEQKTDARFDKIDTRLDAIETRLDTIEVRMATKDDIANMATKDDIASIEARMATKDDMIALEGRLHGDMYAMEGRILDAFKQLVTAVERRLPPPRASRKS